MTAIPPSPHREFPVEEEGEDSEVDEARTLPDLLPLPPPTRVLPDHVEEIPGAEQAEAVDWLRLPHWRLVKELQTGNQEALAWIMDTYRAPLLRYAGKLVAGEADPEDIVQEAFFRLWARRASLRPTGSVRAFLFISVRTIARDEYRRWGRRRRSTSRDLQLQPSVSGNPSEDLQGSELLGSFREAVASLSPRRQEVFRLIREDGLSMDEAARRLNLTPRTVKNTMSAALSELRKKLGPFLR